MSETSHPAAELAALRIDEACNRFEAAWKAGAAPRIEDCLDDWAEPERSALLRELIYLDLHYRRSRGEACRIEDYLDRFPQLDRDWLAGAFAADKATLATPPAEGADGVLATTSALPAASTSAAPAALIGHPRYQVQELLGVGGMGAVFKARHLLMERTVALKLINHDLIDQPGAVERFRREVKAAARLTHPNIVAAYDAEQAGDAHFLVMEYVEGASLARLVDAERPLAAALACDYVRQAALGLQHAHEQGMVHRDIKPHNLMLTPRGHVKVLDFGLARFAQESQPAGALTRPPAAETAGAVGESLTQAGSVMGTPDYMAPEQIRDAHAADVRADIYSLGCTLYGLLAGRLAVPRRHDGAEGGGPPQRGAAAAGGMAARSSAGAGEGRRPHDGEGPGAALSNAGRGGRGPAAFHRRRNRAAAPFAASLARRPVKPRGRGGPDRRYGLLALAPPTRGRFAAASGRLEADSRRGARPADDRGGAEDGRRHPH